MPFTSWSIHREDVLLHRALADIRPEDGFYIDVGANSPSEESFTKLFYDLGWRGLNIEPSSHWYRRLAAERPRDINIHAACSDKPGRVTLFDHPEGGLGTINEAFADRHEVERAVAKRAVDVEAVTLVTLCERHAPPVIHFLKIDVEGHEEQVLRGMDFARFRPWILCIEATEPLRLDVLTHEAWDPMVRAAGYGFVQFDGLNRWYVAEEHPERMPPFAFPADDYVHWTLMREVDRLRCHERTGVDRDFVATCYEVLLGRELENERVADERRHLDPTAMVASVVTSPEFREAVYEPMVRCGQPTPGRFYGSPSVRHRIWATDRLPLLVGTATRIRHAQSWAELLSGLLSDPRFLEVGRLAPFPATE